MSGSVRWGVEWHSVNQLDGDNRYLMWHKQWPLVFNTREEARRWIERHYGYIRYRKDLQCEPHGWRSPKAVKVTLTLDYAR